VQPAGGFWGFLTAILLSMTMWAYVHTFPDGYRPNPQVVLGKGAVVTIEEPEKPLGKTVDLAPVR